MRGRSCESASSAAAPPHPQRPTTSGPSEEACTTHLQARSAHGVGQMIQRSGEVELAAHDRITGVRRITVDRLERDVDDAVLVEVDAVRHEECP